MKMVKLLQLSGLIVMLAFISACRHKPKDGLTDTYTSGVIAIAADESFRPIVQEVLSARDKDCDGWACVNNESGQSGHIDWSERSSPYSYRGGRTVERYLSLIPFGGYSPGIR